MRNNTYKKFLLSLFKPYKKSIIFLILLLILSSIINIIIPLVSKNIIDEGFNPKSYSNILFFSFLYLVLYISTCLIAFIKDFLRANINVHIKNDLYSKFFYKLQKIYYKFLKETNNTELYNKIDTDIQNMLMITDESLVFCITEIFSIIGGIIGLCLINIKMTLLILLFLPVKFFIVRFFTKLRETLVTLYIQSNCSYAKWFDDFMSGIKDIRIFGIGNFKYKEFKEKISDLIKVEKKFILLDSLNQNSDQILSSILITSIYIFSASYILNDMLSLGSLFAFTTYTSKITQPISAILNIKYLFANILPSTERFCKFIELDNEIPGKELFKINDEIQFNIKNISFKYDDKCIFNNLSIDIKSGDMIAIVGKNGTGKSTFINILLRMYNINNGFIKLNGKDIYTLNIDDYRNLFTIVSQDIHIFNMSIRDNILLYRKFDEDKFNDIINICGLKDLVENKNENIGCDGNKLSGGEKQKIALARALINNRPIIILDEATSNIDHYSEININNLLTNSFKDKIIIFISHKIDLLKKTDKVLFLEYNGEYLFDTHENLLNNEIEYKNFINNY